jgi:phosphatidylserine/phosphatidylglycerophosphate/cardiolipin synthase-like enzyme
LRRVLSFLLALVTCSVLAAPSLVETTIDTAIDAAIRFISSRSASAPPSGYEVAFSPDRGAEELVLKLIGQAKTTIRVAAYSFTSRPIAEALVAAKRRGVDVRIVVDKSQLSERYTFATFTANMGIPTRVNSNYAIFHNKYLVVDQQHVGTGSFNFTSSAAHRNAENFLAVWDNPTLAASYTNRWQSYWAESRDYRARY